MVRLKDRHPDRYHTLERLLSATHTDSTATAAALYTSPHDTREKRRRALVQAVWPYLVPVPPGRLLQLLGDAMRWRQYQGALPDPASGAGPATASLAYDLWRGTLYTRAEDLLAMPNMHYQSIQVRTSPHRPNPFPLQTRHPRQRHAMRPR